MDSFLPGPWVAKSPDKDPNAFDVYSADGSQLYRGFWGGKATSLLIAAAPELLGLLEEHLRWYVGGPPIENNAKWENNLIDRTRAAIAKARGKDD